MNSGMLWYDNDPKTELNNKVSQAAAYYKKKYGHTPNMCYVHTSMLTDKSAKAGSINIKTTKSILPHHFWLGVNEK